MGKINWTEKASSHLQGIHDYIAKDSKIGHALADEVFRVFARQHPRIEIRPIRANKNVKQVIQRALSGSAEQDASHENN